MAGRSDELLREFVNRAPIAIAMLDRDVRYVAASLRWYADYALGDRDIIGLSHYDLFPDMPERWRYIHERALAGELIYCDEDSFEKASGETRWLRWEVRPWYDDLGQGGFTIVSEDITDRVQDRQTVEQLKNDLEHRMRERAADLEDTVTKLKDALAVADDLRGKLREQAIRDPLTGLYNRRFLEETLNHEVARARRARSRFSVLMFDMDNFKEINDNFCQDYGDAVLRAIGRLITSDLRGQDVACRFGGDEFVVVMPETSIENAHHKANELLGRLRHLHLQLKMQSLEEPLPCIEFSMGIAEFPKQGSSGADLLRAADAALYCAKEAGGGRVVATA